MKTEVLKAGQLERYYAPNLPFIENDDLGTTFLVSGAVILASLLTKTRSPNLLSDATGLPLAFTGLIIETMDLNDFWASDRYTDLARTLQNRDIDYPAIMDSLNSFLEGFWLELKMPLLGKLLAILRGGKLLGGGYQNWTDLGAPLELQISANDLARIPREM
ncbi:MAG: hypothetical protein WBE76_19140 [Terracidiphilus sp.]